jgi:hypothetical protein
MSTHVLTYFVMAALEAAIHRRPRLRANMTLWRADTRLMGGRVKPGHDG